MIENEHSLNCTFMELKVKFKFVFSLLNLCLNCTFMELKECIGIDTGVNTGMS